MNPYRPPADVGTIEARPGLAVRIARVVLALAGAAWAILGLFAFVLFQPTKQEDGSYWFWVEPISAEEASRRMRHAALMLLVGVMIAVVHWATAAYATSRARWMLVVLGGLYVVAAVALGTAFRLDLTISVVVVVSATIGAVLITARWSA